MVGVRRPTEPLLFSGADDEESKDQRHRQLSGDNDGGYLVDADGNAYESYSLSWRYLGMFIDSCDGNDRNRGRGLEDGNNNNYYCRKVLWAAYHDPGYKGGSIGEYSFYNSDNGKWDSRTCRAQTWWPFTRCQKLNCHEAKTKFELVGVFKETDGLYDWTEQLFKHQGYCLWDADKNDGESGDSKDGSGDDESSSDYNFMTNLAENWVAGCSQLGAVDANGNYLYYDTKPLPAGDITYGVYTDASCLTESSLSWSDVLDGYSANDDNGGGGGDEGDLTSLSSFDRWNALLSDYKVCQPCRAYNRVKSGNGGSHDSGSGDSGDYEDGDDGEGGKEQWGFNCYDDAGYQNCNQCYKFQTQTDMEQASVDDLERATAQGTILAVKVDGKTYGKGHYAAPHRARRALIKTSAVLLSVAALAGLGYLLYKHYWKKRRRVEVDELNDGLFAVAPDPEKEEGKFSKYFAAEPKKERRQPFFFEKAPADPAPIAEARPTMATLDPAPRSEARSTTTKAAADREKKALEAQIQERDAKLSEQEKLIQELQRKLETYETSEKGKR